MMLSKSETNRLAKAVAAVMSPVTDELLTIETASKLLSTSVAALYRRVSRKQVPYRKVHGRLYFSKNELTNFYLSSMK